MELFAKAVKTNLVFTTNRGVLTPQDVYQLPLTGNHGFNLDVLSREVLKTVREQEEESLVASSKTKCSQDELRLEVLKFIIKDKQDERDKAENEAVIKQKREQLLKLRAKKQEAMQEELTIEEIDLELSQLK